MVGGNGGSERRQAVGRGGRHRAHNAAATANLNPPLPDRQRDEHFDLGAHSRLSVGHPRLQVIAAAVLFSTGGAAIKDVAFSGLLDLILNNNMACD